MKLLFAITIIISAQMIFSDSRLFAQTSDLNNAYELFRSAQSFEDMIKSAEAFEKVSINNSDNWQAAYWTAFTYSQAGRLSNEKMKYYQKSFKYLDRASDNINSENKDVYVYSKALEALLYSLSQGPEFASGNTEKGLEYITLQKKAINEGLKADPNSPLLLVLIGTGMISDAMRNQNELDRTKLVTGKVLLERAQSIYDKMPEANELIPDRWNKGWINVWMNRVEQSLN